MQFYKKWDVPQHLFRKTQLRNTPFAVKDNEKPVAAYKNKHKTYYLYDREKEMFDDQFYISRDELPHYYLTKKELRKFGYDPTKENLDFVYLITHNLTTKLFDTSTLNLPTIYHKYVTGYLKRGQIKKLSAFGIDEVKPDEQPVGKNHEFIKLYDRSDHPFFSLPGFTDKQTIPPFFVLEDDLEFKPFDQLDHKWGFPYGYYVSPSGNVQLVFDLREVPEYRLHYLMDDNYDPRKE